MQVITIEENYFSGELKQNTYVAILNDKCFIIDAGASIQKVLQATQNKKVAAIFITHCHYDHISKIEEYDKTFDCPIYIHKNGKRFLEDPQLNLSAFFYTPKKYNLKNVCFLNGNEILKFGKNEISCIYSPGHTTDSMCFLFPDKTLFVGDTFFYNSVGATHFPTGNPKQLALSLQNLLKLDFNQAFTGHMRKTNKTEQLTNLPPFINILNKN